MQTLRTLLVWVLVLCLPIEGMAANLMPHCKDMQNVSAGQSMQGMSEHDHAAMMAMGNMSMDGMSDAEMAAMHGNHSMQGDSTDQPTQSSLDAGCKCGCKCSGNCAMSCAGMMVSLVPMLGFLFDGQLISIHTVMPRGQAHAAYRYDPLRPPSAVAL